MKTFWALFGALFLFGLGWLLLVHPYEPPSLAVLGDRVYYIQGPVVRIFGSSGVPQGSWRAPGPVRQAVVDGDRLGLVLAGKDDLELFSADGTRQGAVPAPQKADGQGRWVSSADRWMFLHAARAALFIRPKEAGEWKLMLGPEEELIRPVDATATTKGAVILCEEPPLIAWYTFEGAPDGELDISMRLVPSVRYFIFEDWMDFLKTQRATLPYRLAFSPEGKALLLFRTPDDKYRRLVHLRKKGEDWSSHGVFLPSIPGHGRRGFRPPRDVAFYGTGFLMTGREGGMWFFKDERLPAVKPWVEPPPIGRWEKFRHQRRWGWLGLLLSLLFLWLAIATRGARVVIPREAIRGSVASLLVPGLGQVLAGKRGWGLFWFLATVFWAWISVTLILLMRKGNHVTSVTLFESFLCLALAWLLSVVHAFWLGFQKRDS